MSIRRALMFAVVLFVVLFNAVYYFGSHASGEPSSVLDKTAWQRMASPALSLSPMRFWNTTVPPVTHR